MPYLDLDSPIEFPEAEVVVERNLGLVGQKSFEGVLDCLVFLSKGNLEKRG